MYICDYCSEPIGPRVPLNLRAIDGEERHTTYTNRVPDPDDELGIRTMIKNSVGTEITRMFKVCPGCSGVPTKVEVKTPILTLSEPLAMPATFQLRTIAVEKLIERTTHQTKRANADVIVAMSFIQSHAQRVGAIK